MRHTYECQLRWADMDLLGHVNNVVYVDYLQQARIDMFRIHAPDARTHDLAEGVVVVRQDVQFVAPLVYRPRPVLVDVWVSHVGAATFTLAYEVYDTSEGQRTVYLRATSTLAPYVFAEERPRRVSPAEKQALQPFLGDVDERLATTALAAVRRSEPGHHRLQTRFSDVDVYGHVNNVVYFEYFQEARIEYLQRLWESRPLGTAGGGLVVAHTSVEYHVPVLFRTEPYDAWSAVTHVGRSSFVVDGELCDGDQVLARARSVLVTFDRETQRPVPPPEHQRALLQAELPGGAGPGASTGVSPGS